MLHLPLQQNQLSAFCNQHQMSRGARQSQRRPRVRRALCGGGTHGKFGAHVGPGVNDKLPIRRPGRIDSTAKFSAEMNMETSDYGITQTIVAHGVTQPSVNKDDPTTRGTHTHHISMTDGVVTSDWSSCPTFKPFVTGGFVVIGTAFIAGNGGPAPFGNPSPLTLCVLGGTTVKYSNMTVTLGVPATKHFGVQPIHGVVVWCAGKREQKSEDCTVEE